MSMTNVKQKAPRPGLLTVSAYLDALSASLFNGAEGLEFLPQAFMLMFTLASLGLRLICWY